MGGPRIAVVTDSASSLPSAVSDALGVTIVPVHVRVGADTYVETADLTTGVVASAQQSGADVSTVEPSVDEFAETYRAAARAGAEAVVSIHVSSAFSRTLDNARLAADRSKIPVTLVESGTIAMGEALVVLAAAAVAADGKTTDEVAGAALATARSCRFLFTVEGLDHLRRGGRISATLRAVGNLLDIRPVMSIHDGETSIVERVRHVEGARSLIQSSMELYATTLARPAACVGHVPSPGADIAISIDGVTIDTTVNPSLMAHTGPGTCGVAVADMPAEFAKYRRLLDAA